MKKFESPSLPEPYRAPAPVLDADYEPQPAHVPLAHYLWILRRHGWRIAAFIVGAVLATLIVSLRLTPIYESTATVDIDRQMPTGVLGEEAMQNATNDADQFLATQVKLIQSDSVLRPVVDKFHLREVEKDALEEAIDKSPTSLEAPVILKNLKVTRPPNTYLLLISYRSPNRQLASDVANEIAQSYLLHTYRIRYKATAGLSDFMERQLEELKAQMEKSSEALASFERELNVINPEEKTNILSAHLLQLNEEYTKAQGDRVTKEAAFNSIQSGSLAAAQVSTQGEALKKLTENFNEAQEKFAEVKTHFGINHPEYKKAQTQVDELARQIDSTRKSIGQRIEIEYREALNRESMLEQSVKETKAEWDRLNARSFEYQSLKREAESDKKLYEELVRKIKEAGINASFQNSSIRVADTARPGLKPVFPKTWLNVLLAFLFATFFGVGAAVLSDVLDNTIRDPDQVARLLNADVIGSLPAVKDWRRRLSPIQTHALQGHVVNGNGNGHHNADGKRGQPTLSPAHDPSNGHTSLISGQSRLSPFSKTHNGPLQPPDDATNGHTSLISAQSGLSPFSKTHNGPLQPPHDAANGDPSGHRALSPFSKTHNGPVQPPVFHDPPEPDQALTNYEEAIRTLRNSILLTDFDRRLRSVLLTSASPSEGKSTVAAHLAVTHARQHKRTLLIDGDLRRPSVHRLFQIPNNVGLSNVLMNQVPGERGSAAPLAWSEAVVSMDEPKGLDILPAGPSSRRASDLIGMGLAELIEEATREYDLVVLDAPPLLGFAEPLQMATTVDGVIIVARAGDTSRKALNAVVTTLARLRANLVGVVLNEVHKEVSAGYYYYYGHYSKYYERQKA